MSYPFKKIIHYHDNGNNYNRLVFEPKIENQMEYAVGDFGRLVPKEAKLKYDEGLEVDRPLFNGAGNTRIVEQIGGIGLLYLELQPELVLNEIFVEPDDIVVDVYYGTNALIYGFYNASDSNVISLNLSITSDIHNAFSKIKSHSTDLEWRQYFIRQAMVKPGVRKIQQPDPTIRELMNADQVADYLQVKKKTIQNWTSDGKIPFCHIGGSVRYRKSEIDEELSKKK